MAQVLIPLPSAYLQQAWLPPICTSQDPQRYWGEGSPVHVIHTFIDNCPKGGLFRYLWKGPTEKKIAQSM